MSNRISIVEIPVSDLKRAIRFYETILDVKIEEVEMGETLMGVIPGDPEGVNVVLVKGTDYIPTKVGSLLYLNGGENLQPVLDKVVKNGGTLLFEKTEISPEMGFFAHFLDSEGNKMGLHSIG